MQRWSVSRRISFLLTAALLVGISAAAALIYRWNTSTNQFRELIALDIQTMLSARAMQVDFKKQIQEWKDILLRGTDPENLQKYTNAYRQQGSRVKAAAESLHRDAHSTEVRSLVEQFITAYDEMNREYDSALAGFTAARGTNSAETDKLVKGRDRGPTDFIDRIVETSRRDADRRSEALIAQQATDGRVISTIVGIAFLVVAALCTVVVRRLHEALRATIADLTLTAEQVAGAAGQVSDASQSLAQGSSEQAASLEESAASTEEINSMASANGEKSRRAADVMAQAHEKFMAANSALHSAVTAMHAIGESSERIAKIIKVIDEIAFQTNILALNAAVEAARAGEVGMGFAVVADEVRNLAQRSAHAARETAELIEAAVAKSKDGTLRINEVAKAIHTVTADSEGVKTLVDEVNHGSQEQVHGIQQISKAVIQMEQVTQTTAATAEENAAAAEQLTAQSEALKKSVAKLRLLIAASA